MQHVAWGKQRLLSVAVHFGSIVVQAFSLLLELQAKGLKPGLPILSSSGNNGGSGAEMPGKE